MKKTDMTNEKQNGVQVENEELVRQIQAGINVSSNLEQLYLKNRPFIYNTARKYSKQAEIDDLMQEGYLGLQKAASMYNPDHETKFISSMKFKMKLNHLNSTAAHIDFRLSLRRITLYKPDSLITQPEP